MNQIYEKLVKCADAVKSKIKFQPKVALILGSGLGDYAETMQVEETMEYTEIEGFPVSTVAGHKGRFLFGYVEGVPVVAMQGRVHFYEGYPMQDVVLPVRLMGMLGAKIVMLTNAAGGVNFDFHPGDLMLITDQITTAVPSPLIGPNIEELGVRFPDMSEVPHPASGIPHRNALFPALPQPGHLLHNQIKMLSCRKESGTLFLFTDRKSVV